MPNATERFWARVNNTPLGCWEWTAGRDKNGYGKLMFNGRRDCRAHRISWELHYGPIPQGVFVLHRCDNPPCVNPTHLFLGTAADNARDMSEKGRAWEQAKTHCPKGHEYSPENTRVYVSKQGWRMRFCIECDRDFCAANYARNRKKRIADAVAYAKAKRAQNPEEFKRRQRDYMRAHRARKRGAMHRPPQP